MKVSVAGAVRAFNLTREKEAALRKICSRQGIKFKVVPPEEFHLPLNVLFGFVPKGATSPKEEGQETKEKEAPLFQEEMLLMYQLNGSAMDKFLRSLRQEGVTIPLKAVLTPTNSTWFPQDLLQELQKEHEAMSGLC